MQGRKKADEEAGLNISRMKSLVRILEHRFDSVQKFLDYALEEAITLTGSSSSSSNVKTLEETERNQIVKILSDTRWRIEGNNGAAEILGLHPSTLRARMHKLGIRRSGT